jgi:hypothetical protein
MPLMFKIAEIAAAVGIVQWITVYTVLTGGQWRYSHIERSLVYFALLVLGQTAIAIGSLFFNFSRLTSQVAAWIYLIFTCLVAVVMFTRTTVWLRVFRGSNGAVPGRSRRGTAASDRE